jgi:hypothetical protein
MSNLSSLQPHMDLVYDRDPPNPRVEAGTRESAPQLAK